MIIRLFALWFTVGVSGLFSIIHLGIALKHFRYWHFQLGSDPTLPRLTDWFNPGASFYYFPIPLALAAAVVTWKARDKPELSWTLIVVCFGVMALFSAAFHLAMALPEELVIGIPDD